MGIFNEVKPGVIFGDDVRKVFAIAKKEKFAIPAMNVVGSNSINAAMEAAKKSEFADYYSVFKRRRGV